MSLKEVIEKPELLLPGHSACPGCGAVISLRWTLKALGKRTILVIPACCTSVYQYIWPTSAIGVFVYNVAFASAAAVASGISNALEIKGRKDYNVVVWGGDGGILDIGFATVSGAAERGENIIVICYDNEAYMNTGIQRSSGTPGGAWTTTTPLGKTEQKKAAPFIFLLHNAVYVATASPAYPLDLYNKVKKAKKLRGFKYIHILSPCPPGWRYPENLTIKLGKLSVETGYWALWEAERINGKMKFTLSPPSRPYLDPSKRKPIEEYIKHQRRFRDREIAKKLIQEWINYQWSLIKRFMSESSEG